VLQGERGIQIYLVDPSVLMKGLCNKLILPLARLKFFWGYIFGIPSLKPWRMPKRSLSIVINGDGNGSIEQVHILLIARVVGTHTQIFFGSFQSIQGQHK
jgi:hypothetical protein